MLEEFLPVFEVAQVNSRRHFVIVAGLTEYLDEDEYLDRYLNV